MEKPVPISIESKKQYRSAKGFAKITFRSGSFDQSTEVSESALLDQLDVEDGTVSLTKSNSTDEIKPKNAKRRKLRPLAKLKAIYEVEE